MANAWDAYSQNLMQYPKVNFASVHGPDGSVYSCSPTIKTSKEDIVVLIKALKDKVPTPSFTLGGQKFITLRIQDDTIDGKHQNHAVTVAIIDKVIIVGGHIAEKDEKSDQALGAAVNTAVGRVKDYLKSCGM